MNLLFPYGKDNAIELTEDTYHNLAIDELVDTIGITGDDKRIIKDVFRVLPCDAKTALYRQEILKDFLSDEKFCSDLLAIISNLDVLDEFHKQGHFSIEKKSSLWSLISYMEEMEVYIKILEDMIVFFDEHDVKSQGLLEISELLRMAIDEDRIEELKEIVSHLHAEISTLKSITVGINLTPELRPAEVMVLSFDTLPFQSKMVKTSLGMSIAARRKIQYIEPSPFMKYVNDDMEKELSKTVQQIKVELKKYINLKGYFLLDICNDLKTYLLIAKYAGKLINSGYEICMPDIDESMKSVVMKGVYNIRLTKKHVENIVKNDFAFSENEKLFILTGPNRGGKTMLTQAVGLNAFLAAQGLFVTASSYTGYLFNNIFTHFPADEDQTLDLGRLGEEAVRVQNIVKNADNKTLVLLNETYSSTSAYDGLYLATDLVHILKHKDVPMIFNTHIHELACNTKEMNEWDGASNVISLNMEIVDNKNTFRVLRKEPDRNSYAKNIASKYGVTYEQMLDTIE